MTAVSGALGTLLNGRLSSTGAKHWTQAMNLAKARIEYLKSIRYADLSAMPGATVEASLHLDERDAAAFVSCTRTTTLQPEDNGITITVAISWEEKAAGAGLLPWSYDLTTWVGFPGSPSQAGG